MKRLDAASNPMDRIRFVVAGIGVLTSGALIFNLLPILLGVMADALQLAPHQIGLLGGAYMVGFTCASLPAVYLVENGNWRWIMAICSAMVAVCLFATSGVQSFVVALAVFGFIGLSKGTLFGLGNRALGSTSDPDRLVGIGYFVELTVPAILIILFANWIIPAWGHAGVLVTIGLLVIAIAAISSPLLPQDARAATVDHRLPKEKLTRDIVYGLLASVTLFVGAAGMWAFVERLGVSNGIDQATIGNVLSFGLFVTAVASLLPALTEEKFRRSTMLFAMAMLVAVAAYLLSTRGGTTWYFVAVNVFNLAWGASTVYVTAVIAAADGTGRFIVLISGTIGIGAALGPSIAGFLVDGDNYGKVFIMTTVAFVMTAVLALLSGRARVARGMHAEQARDIGRDTQ